MKNITLLALGIFLGAVAVVYAFGPMSGEKNANDPVAVGSTTPFPTEITPDASSSPTPTNSPVSSASSTPVPVASGTPGPTPVSTPAPTSISTPAPTPTPVPTSSTPVLNRAEVAKHSSKANCYLIINSKVYNVSSYFGSHPGGDAVIMGYCGKESSGVFADIHSNYAWDLLNKYFIGNLVGG